MKYGITKTIELDAAHRVPDHGSKCKNLHGHRYKVEVTVCSQGLVSSGEQAGMVMDFGFLKQLMEEYIHKPCDHGTIVYVNDKLLMMKLAPPGEYFEEWHREMQCKVRQFGAWWLDGCLGKLYIVPFIPTAENLAQHWYERLAERVPIRTNGHATIQRVRVWETPTSVCDYPS